MTMLTEAQIYKDVERNIKTQNIKHIEINPHTIVADKKYNGNFEVNTGAGTVINFRFTEQGVGCFQWLWRGYKLDKAIEEKMRYAEFTRLVRAINEKGLDTPRIRTRQQSLLSRIEILINLVCDKEETIFLHLMGDRVIGITRQWNDMISDENILDVIEDDGMLSKVIDSYYDDKAFTFNLKITDADSRFLMMVTNGHSGHETLNYSVVVRFSNYDFISREGGSARHLSNLGFVFGQITETMEKMKSKNLAEKLDTMDGIAFLNKLSGMLSGREGVNPDAYMRGDWRVKVRSLTDVQAEKVEALIADVKKRITGTGMKAFAVVELYNEISQKGKGVKMAAEILMNAYLLEVFEFGV